MKHKGLLDGIDELCFFFLTFSTSSIIHHCMCPLFFVFGLCWDSHTCQSVPRPWPKPVSPGPLSSSGDLLGYSLTSPEQPPNWSSWVGHLVYVCLSVGVCGLVPSWLSYHTEPQLWLWWQWYFGALPSGFPPRAVSRQRESWSGCAYVCVCVCVLGDAGRCSTSAAVI